MAYPAKAKRDPVIRSRRAAIYLLWLLVCLALTVFFIGPFVWMVLTAFKPQREILAWPPQWWPSEFTTVHFEHAWRAMNWPRMFFNSAFIAVTTTIGVIFTSSLAAFAFARMRLPYKNVIFLLVLATMIVPAQVDLIPRFLMMVSWGLTGTYTPVILLAFVQAFNVFLYRQFFLSLPQDLFDSARVDGASFFRMYWSIAMPLAWPATAVTIIFVFLARWNDFLYPLIYLTRPELYTVQLGLAFFQSEAGTQFGPLMAASVFVSLPTILVYIIFQRYFVRGIVMSGVKG